MAIREKLEFWRRIPPKRWGALLQAVAWDAMTLSLALVLSIGLVHNFRFAPADWRLIGWGAPVLSVAAFVLLFFKGLYRVQSRYAGVVDMIHLLQASMALGLLGAGVFYGGALWLGRPFRAVEPVLFFFLTTSGLSAFRLWRRAFEWYDALRDKGRERKRTLIVGGGDAGEMVMREIQRNPESGRRIVGFVDDNPLKRHARIHGYPCLGTTNDIPQLVAEFGIQEIIIAIPSAEGSAIRRIFEICRRTPARIRIVPSIPSIFEKGVQLQQIREVDIEDLLPREPVRFDLRAVSTYIEGERVLITGAGGSIGSELARQVVLLGPAALILLGKGENSIYFIQRELIEKHDYEPRCVIADVRDASRIEAVFREEQPTIVFHAAAHKHVPLMQANPIEAIKNNVLGTWITAESAARNGVRKFVYVSTDKAVKPASIMGATKRVGEMIVQALAHETETEFAIVRFGNVLGSRGSLVPTIQAQIEAGGPVRLTHPEMQRYFMSISEAVHLIMRVGAFESRGDIHILDMGKPVKIVDLAHDLIRLYGLVPGKDIQIIYTGVRPGEKLHEELCYDEEHLEPTVHPKIRRVTNGNAPDWKWLRQQLEVLIDLCESNQAERAQTMLMELATGRLKPPYSAHEVKHV